MLPPSVPCEGCGIKAAVRGYGRVEYDWDTASDPKAAPVNRSVRLTVDCPHCGLHVQDHYLQGRPVAGAGKTLRVGKLSRKLVSG